MMIVLWILAALFALTGMGGLLVLLLCRKDRARFVGEHGAIPYFLSSCCLLVSAALAAKWQSWWPLLYGVVALWTIQVATRVVRCALRFKEASAQGIYNISTLKISPFEGLPVTPLHLLLWGTPCVIGALLTSGVVSVVLWVLAAILLLSFLLLVPRRLANPWQRIHFPLMFRYAKTKGFEVGAAEAAGRPPDTRRAVVVLLQSVHPEKTEADLRSMLDAIEAKIGSPEDTRRIASLLAGAKATTDKREGIEEQIKHFIATSRGRDTAVLYAIADIVEQAYGSDERGRYLLAAFQGKAF